MKSIEMSFPLSFRGEIVSEVECQILYLVTELGEVEIVTILECPPWFVDFAFENLQYQITREIYEQDEDVRRAQMNAIHLDRG